MGAVSCRRIWSPPRASLRDVYAEFPALAARLEFDPTAIPYVDYERLVVSWLLEANPHG